MFHCKEETCAELQCRETDILILREELKKARKEIEEKDETRDILTCTKILISKLQCELESTRADLVQANETIHQLKQQLESRDEEMCILEDNLRFTEQELQEIRAQL